MNALSSAQLRPVPVRIALVVGIGPGADLGNAIELAVTETSLAWSHQGCRSTACGAGQNNSDK